MSGGRGRRFSNEAVAAAAFDARRFDATPMLSFLSAFRPSRPAHWIQLSLERALMTQNSALGSKVGARKSKSADGSSKGSSSSGKKKTGERATN